MAAPVSRRVALAALGVLGVGGVVGIGYVWRGVPGPLRGGVRMVHGPGGMMGVGPVDMRVYMDMFRRHTEIDRVVEEIPGGIRSTTESNSPDLAAQLQAHVAAMYSRLDQGEEVACMSQSLPTLFRSANGYRRRLTFTRTGVIAEETTGDPIVARAIREHAVEVTGFVREGMPAMMEQTMGPGGMMPGHPR